MLICYDETMLAACYNLSLWPVHAATTKKEHHSGLFSYQPDTPITFMQAFIARSLPKNITGRNI